MTIAAWLEQTRGVGGWTQARRRLRGRVERGTNERRRIAAGKHGVKTGKPKDPHVSRRTRRLIEKAGYG